MRNYPPFPAATPHLRTACPRVPHPSATYPPESEPFDLHALGTPPALILSQDQTLHHLSLVRHPVPRWTSPPPQSPVGWSSSLVMARSGPHPERCSPAPLRLPRIPPTSRSHELGGALPCPLPDPVRI